MEFFRVGNTVTKQGLWYSQEGIFTGLIHNQFSFCKNSELAMDFDPEIVGFLSAATSMEELYKWFPVEDILQLQKRGYGIQIYESNNYKFYERFQHYVIDKSTAILLPKTIILEKQY